MLRQLIVTHEAGSQLKFHIVLTQTSDLPRRVSLHLVTVESVVPNEEVFDVTEKLPRVLLPILFSLEVIHATLADATAFILKQVIDLLSLANWWCTLLNTGRVLRLLRLTASEQTQRQRVKLKRNVLITFVILAPPKLPPIKVNILLRDSSFGFV